MREREDRVSIQLWLYIFISLLFSSVLFFVIGAYGLLLSIISITLAFLITFYYLCTRKPKIPLFIICIIIFCLILLFIGIYEFTYFHGIFICWGIFVFVITSISSLSKRGK